jgi:DNA-binding Xre family transcriptional regulator
VWVLAGPDDVLLGNRKIQKQVLARSNTLSERQTSLFAQVNGRVKTKQARN